MRSRGVRKFLMRRKVFSVNIRASLSHGLARGAVPLRALIQMRKNRHIRKVEQKFQQPHSLIVCAAGSSPSAPECGTLTGQLTESRTPNGVVQACPGSSCRVASDWILEVVVWGLSSGQVHSEQRNESERL
jgi:hypothetical protein